MELFSRKRLTAGSVQYLVKHKKYAAMHVLHNFDILKMQQLSTWPDRTLHLLLLLLLSSMKEVFSVTSFGSSVTRCWNKK